MNGSAIAFQYPLIALAPLLYLLVRALAPMSTKPSAVRFSSLLGLRQLPLTTRQRLRRPLITALSLIFLTLIALAAARPQRKLADLQRSEARNLILALDVSRSMSTPDFGSGFGRTSRLEGVKQVVSEFLQNRSEDRVGLIVFGSNAFVQSPLTRDHMVVAQLVERLGVGMAGDGTAIGDGLGLSLKRISDLPAPSKAIVLLTDGVSNSGQVTPVSAAQVAHDMGVRVYTIGIGSDQTAQRAKARGASQNVGMEFDEATLKEIARLTGGTYSNAGTIEGLKGVYDQIDLLERSSAEDLPQAAIEELYAPLALAALLAYLLYLGSVHTIFRVLP